MSLDNVAIFRAMNEKLNWLSQKQTVLSNNVANADTPGYRPQKIEEFDFARALQSASRGNAGEARRTSERHLSSIGGGEELARQRDQRTVYETAPDGNSVIIEEQMMEASKTAMEYQTMINLYRKQLDMVMMSLRSQ